MGHINELTLWWVKWPTHHATSQATQLTCMESQDWTHLAVLDEAVVPFPPEVGEVAEASEEQVAGH